MGNRYVKGDYNNPGEGELRNYYFRGYKTDQDGEPFDAPERGDTWPIVTTGTDGPIDVEIEVYSVTVQSRYTTVDFVRSNPVLSTALPGAEILVGTQGPKPSALFAGEINVQTMFAGEIPVSAAYVGNAQVYPSKVVPDYQMEVSKNVKGWMADGKYYIEYTITNTGKEPMFVTAEILRATGQEIVSGESIKATFSTIETGTYNLAITARTINDYAFDVYEDEVVVPSKNDVVEYSYRVVLGTGSDSGGYTPGTINPRLPSKWYMNNTDLNGNIHPLSGGVWTLEGEGQKEVVVFDNWGNANLSDGTKRGFADAVPEFTSSFTGSAIWTMKQGEW